MATLLGESITRNRMTGTEQLSQILLPTTETWGSVRITKTLRADTANCMDPTIQPTIIHFKQETGPGHSDRNHFPIGGLNSDIWVPRSRLIIDNHAVMNPQGHIVTTIPESNRRNNCNIFKFVIRTSDLVYIRLPWNGKIKSGSKNIVEKLRSNNIFKNARGKNNSVVQNFEQKIL